MKKNLHKRKSLLIFAAANSDNFNKILKMNRQFFFLIVIFVLCTAIFTSCKDDNIMTSAEMQKEAILTELGKNSDFSEFAKELKNLDFADINTDKLIIFAVRNSGMNKSTQKSSVNDELNIKRHLVTANDAKEKLVEGLKLTALDGSTLSITEAPVGGYIYVNDVEIDEEIIVDNNVIFVVESIIPAVVTPIGCDDELYYYDASGNKILINHLFLNNYLVVGFRQGNIENINNQLSEIENFIIRTGFFKPIDWSVGRSIAYSNTDIVYIELWLSTKERKTCYQMNEIVRTLEKEQIVSFAHVTFKNIMTFNPEFYVVTDNISDLYEVTQETNTTIIQNYQNNYTILADKNSMGNALQMANYFYDTGKFTSVVPAFWNAYNPDDDNKPPTGTSKITMITRASNVTIDMAGVGDVVIDWGDGTIETHPLFNVRHTVFSRHTHNYSGISNRTITITGGDITEYDCWDNQLTSLDVSASPGLKILLCAYNQLTSLDVSANTELIELFCLDNKITTLDISKNKALRYLLCQNNQLTTLDVSNNTLLINMYCDNNQISVLDVSNNTGLQWLVLSSNKLTTLDLKKNTGLIELFCDNNNFSTAALNDILGSLHGNAVSYIWKRVHIGNNPGTKNCNVNIAMNKGWEVFNGGIQINRLNQQAPNPSLDYFIQRILINHRQHIDKQEKTSNN